MYNNYGENPRISERTLRSMISNSKIEKAIINTGYTADELASELGIDVADLLDENNLVNLEDLFSAFGDVVEDKDDDSMAEDSGGDLDE